MDGAGLEPGQHPWAVLAMTAETIALWLAFWGFEIGIACLVSKLRYGCILKR